jgi:hypothetical protein
LIIGSLERNADDIFTFDNEEIDLDKIDLSELGDINLKKEIQSSEDISQEATLHANMKLFFATIPDKDRAKLRDEKDNTKLSSFKFIDARFAYAKSLEIFKLFEMNNRTNNDLLQQLDNIAKTMKMNFSGTFLMAAVKDAIRRTIPTKNSSPYEVFDVFDSNKVVIIPLDKVIHERTDPKNDKSSLFYTFKMNPDVDNNALPNSGDEALAA